MLSKSEVIVRKKPHILKIWFINEHQNIWKALMTPKVYKVKELPNEHLKLKKFKLALNLPTRVYLEMLQLYFI